MTPERFRRLTEAYGAMPEHWPLAERAETKALLAQRDPAVLAALAEARSLDLVLSRHDAAPAASLDSLRQRAGSRASASDRTAPFRRHGRRARSDSTQSRRACWPFR